ncbi:MAG: hypothetical protein WC603_02645 [Candidatus Paceibacterota bacterium]|jgi:hypothetical protein
MDFGYSFGFFFLVSQEGDWEKGIKLYNIKILRKMEAKNLNFYHFAFFYQMLKKKFPGFYFYFSGTKDQCQIIEISKNRRYGPGAIITTGQIMVEIHNPTAEGYFDFEKFDPQKEDTGFIEIIFFVSGWGGWRFDIKKESFDNDEFIKKLSEMIGLIAPKENQENEEKLREWIMKKSVEFNLGFYGVSGKMSF